MHLFFYMRKVRYKILRLPLQFQVFGDVLHLPEKLLRVELFPLKCGQKIRKENELLLDAFSANTFRAELLCEAEFNNVALNVFRYTSSENFHPWAIEQKKLIDLFKLRPLS